MARYAWLAALVVPLAASAASLDSTAPCWSFRAEWPDAGNAAIDEDLARWVRDLEAEFTASLRSFPACGREGCGRCRGTLRASVVRDDADVLSIAFELFEQFGGSYPTRLLPHRTYLKPDGRRVLVGELLSDEGVRRLGELATEALRRQVPPERREELEPSLKLRAGPVGANFESFTLTNDALVVQWCAGCLFGHAAGEARVAIPIAALKPFLRADPRAPAPSFDCAKASTAVERALCADWRLARAERLASDQLLLRCAQLDLRASRSDARGSCRELRADQARWVKLRDERCGGLDGDALARCLLPLLDARGRELSQWEPR